MAIQAEGEHADPAREAAGRRSGRKAGRVLSPSQADRAAAAMRSPGGSPPPLRPSRPTAAEDGARRAESGEGGREGAAGRAGPGTRSGARGKPGKGESRRGDPRPFRLP